MNLKKLKSVLPPNGIKTSAKRCASFWHLHPALFYGFHLLLGLGASFEFHIHLFIPLFFLLFPAFFEKTFLKKACLALLVSSAAYLSGTYYYSLPKLPAQGVHGSGTFTVHSIAKIKNRFSSNYLYKGELDHFASYKKPIPCTLCIQDRFNRFQANTTYLIEGTLTSKGKCRYHLKSHLKRPWQKVKDNYNLSEWRFLIKNYLKKHILSSMKNHTVAELLSGIFMGEMNAINLKYSLSKLGLQHILAISGFHFTILATLLSLLLSTFLNPKATTILLIFFLTFYFLLIGPLPSVERAWISSMLFLIGNLLGRTSPPLNRLGMALLVVLMTDPFFITQIGFYLSFAATGGILLLYTPIEELFTKIWKKRSLESLQRFNLTNKLGYLALVFFKKALSLNCAVFLTTFFILLFLFQEFPLISLIYNLFFPLLISLSFSLLLFSLLLDFLLPPFGSLLHFINESYTSFILRFVTHVPQKLTVPLKINTTNETFLIIFITLLFLIGILLHEQAREKKENHLFHYL